MNTNKKYLPDTNILDLRGEKFGRWTVLSLHEVTYDRRGARIIFWWCRCDCGNEKRVNQGNLTSLKTKSCGCLKVEISREKATSHGMTDTTEYRSYSHAKGRCENPTDNKYYAYGARGIGFRFKSFEEFYEHIGPKPGKGYSLDRIEVNKHYEHGNVRWANDTTQMNNMRRNRYLTINGETKTLAQWCGGSRTIMYNRISKGLNRKNPKPFELLYNKFRHLKSDNI